MEEELYLLLGCFENKVNDFVLCCGVENKILKLDPADEFYEELSKHLDSLRLFEKPIININTVRHVLFNIKNKYDYVTRPIWTEQEFKTLEQFTIEHKKCGLYLKLGLISADFDPCGCKEHAESVFIPCSG